ncbi:MAG: hypothetical protein IIX59_09185, partial [Alistipes sp.]|nr:hypothetical protein [Alistipes sp.]
PSEQPNNRTNEQGRSGVFVFVRVRFCSACSVLFGVFGFVRAPVRSFGLFGCVRPPVRSFGSFGLFSVICYLYSVLCTLFSKKANG